MAKPKIDWKHVDRPAVMETFCDYLQTFTFDGQSLRFELCVERLDMPKEGVKRQKLTGRRITCARLILSVDAGNDLLNKLQTVAGQMQLDQAKEAGQKVN